MNEETKAANQVIHIYADGSGRRPDGKGSGYAWFRQDTGEKKVVRENGLTNNQAEYRAIRSALEALPALPTGTTVEILSDSENTVFQLRGERRVRDPYLIDLYTEIHHIISSRELTVQFTWIPRRENLAGKLI